MKKIILLLSILFLLLTAGNTTAQDEEENYCTIYAENLTGKTMFISTYYKKPHSSSNKWKKQRRVKLKPFEMRPLFKTNGNHFYFYVKTRIAYSGMTGRYTETIGHDYFMTIGLVMRGLMKLNIENELEQGDNYILKLKF